MRERLCADPAAPPSRPRLLPEPGWKRWALCLLLGFALFKGAVWTVAMPMFRPPDEDYHAMYIDSLASQGKLPSPDRPLYTREFTELADLTYHEESGPSSRETYGPDPKAAVRELERLPDSAREGEFEGRGVGVVHPPLYHLAGVVVARALDNRSLATRVTALRWMSAAFGVLAVWAAWLLAAQVLPRFSQQFFVALLVALQPLLSGLSGIVNHDILLVALFTAALAMMAFCLRTAPQIRQGAWLGGAIALALMTKATALVLLPLAALAYAGQGLAYGRWREVGRSALLALALVLVIAGPWYVRSQIVYGSPTGATDPILPNSAAVEHASSHPATAAGGGEEFSLPSSARRWMNEVYRTYWFGYLEFEAPRGRSFYFLPLFLGLVGIAGLGLHMLSGRRQWRAPQRPSVRQAALLAAAVIALVPGFLYVDMVRASEGLGFFVNAGRFMIPAFPAAVVCLALGITALFRRRAQPLVLAATATFAAWLMLWVFLNLYVYRYFDSEREEGWWERLRRMSFDRPEFVTEPTIAAAMVIAVATLVGSVALLVYRSTRHARLR